MRKPRRFFACPLPTDGGSAERQCSLRGQHSRWQQRQLVVRQLQFCGMSCENVPWRVRERETSERFLISSPDQPLNGRGTTGSRGWTTSSSRVAQVAANDSAAQQTIVRRSPPCAKGLIRRSRTELSRVMLIDPPQFKVLSDLVQKECQGRGRLETLTFAASATADNT
ncbi:hypothetical protein L210DRAFT_2969488 [Boletus edulis BED1]|uniref:Ribosome maturation protein SDO1/SBDS C-terminal domain-containing protein n=1 Tax=Boletus edulis BED1 TaxID=1328754 RepID=A0AAD4C2X9_BOLED|nr:hypothetical protein L210DRAFT_2969488 [Boletus edulis BED1]